MGRGPFARQAEALAAKLAGIEAKAVPEAPKKTSPLLGLLSRFMRRLKEVR